ncbi:MAG: hypothetical protein EHM79_06525 [Geobacter sp.]|nr:MAG: hypothetical protein EHM79_06525 [Geobacter sp.]
MKRLWNKRLASAASLTAIFVLGGNLTAFADQYIFANRQTVTIPELDAMRGGFVTNGGLQISLGIIKAVLVDGVLQTVNSLNISNITNVNNSLKNVTTGSLQVNNIPSEPATGQASNVETGNAPNNDSTIVQSSGIQLPVQQENVPNQQSGGTTLVQNLGNLTLIQNSLDQKVIQNITIVNTTVNSLSMLRQLNMTSNIKQQFINMLH